MTREQIEKAAMLSCASKDEVLPERKEETNGGR